MGKKKEEERRNGARRALASAEVKEREREREILEENFFDFLLEHFSLHSFGYGRRSFLEDGK